MAATLLIASAGCLNLAEPERPINGTWEAKETPAGFLLYESSKGFTIEYPPEWMTMEFNESGAFFISPQDGEAGSFKENVGVTYNPQIVSTIPIDRMYDAEIAAMTKEAHGFQVLTSEKIMFNGLPA